MFICNDICNTHTHTHSSGHAATFGYRHSRRLLCPHTHVISHTYVHLPRRPLYYWAVIAFLAHCTPRARLLSVLHTHTLSLSPHSTRCVQVPACLIAAADRTFFCLLPFCSFAIRLLASFFILHTLTHTN